MKGNQILSILKRKGTIPTYSATFMTSSYAMSSHIHWTNRNKARSSSEIPPIASQYLQRILTSQVYGAAIVTPLTHAVNMSTLLGNEVYLKREDCQPVFSFKIRGAYNRIAKLDEDLLKKEL